MKKNLSAWTLWGVLILMIASACASLKQKDPYAQRYLTALKNLMENDRRIKSVYADNDTLAAKIEGRIERVERTIDSLEIYVQQDKRRRYRDYEPSLASAIKIITEKPDQSIPKLLEELEESKKLDQQLIVKSEEIEEKVEEEVAEGKMDSVALEKIIDVTTVIREEAVKELEAKETAITGLKTVYAAPSPIPDPVQTQIIESAYQTVTRIRQQGSGVQQRNLERLNLVVDVIEIDNFTQFEAAAFFGPGAYTIKDADIPKVEAAFEPLINSIINFVNQYRDRDMTLTIVAKGYADATAISKSSPLYASLQPQTGVANPSRGELNRALSRLRSDEMSKHMRNLLLRRDAELFSNTSNVSIDIVSQGKGEECPYINKPCDKANDPNRRIVTFHWLVTPNKL